MLLRAILLGVFLVLSACVQVTSSPSGAGVFISGQKVGQTPYSTGQVPSAFYGNSAEVWVDMPGYAIDSVRTNGDSLHFMLRPVTPAAKEAGQATPDRRPATAPSESKR